MKIPSSFLKREDKMMIEGTVTTDIESTKEHAMKREYDSLCPFLSLFPIIVSESLFLIFVICKFIFHFLLVFNIRTKLK